MLVALFKSLILINVFFYCDGYCETDYVFDYTSQKCIRFFPEKMSCYGALRRCSLLKGGYSYLSSINEVDNSTQQIFLDSVENNSTFHFPDTAKNYGCVLATFHEVNDSFTFSPEDSKQYTFFCETLSLLASLSMNYLSYISITASSMLTFPENLSIIAFKPERAFSNSTFYRGSYHGRGWCSKSTAKEYLEVDFQGTFSLKGLLIGSGAIMDCVYNVDSFTLHVYHQNSWRKLVIETDYRKSNTSTSEDIFWLAEPKLSQKLRLSPLSCRSSCESTAQAFCLTMDVYGNFINKNFRKIKVANSFANESKELQTLPSGTYALRSLDDKLQQFCNGFIVYKAFLIPTNQTSLVAIQRGEFVAERICVINNTDSNINFPSGSYCVYSSGAVCPNGFYEVIGKELFEAEMILDKTRFMKHFNESVFNETKTTIGYCCTNDAHQNHESFSLEAPFYLLPLKKSCQTFRGFTNELISLQFTRTNKTVFDIGIHHSIPYVEVETNVIKKYYCKYEPISFIEELRITPRGPVFITENGEFQLHLLVLSDNKVIKYGPDSNLKVLVKPLNMSCTELSETQTFIEGTLIIQGKTCSGINGSQLFIEVNSTNSKSFVKNVHFVFTKKLNILFLYESSFQKELDNLKFNQQDINSRFIESTREKPIFTNDLLHSVLRQDFFVIVSINPEEKLNDILSISEGFDVPAFIYESESNEFYRPIQQTRYISSNLFDEFLLTLTNTDVRKSRDIVLYRVPGVITLFEFYAIYKTGNKLFRDVIIDQHVSESDVTFLKDCPNCFIFMFLDSRRLLMLLPILIQHGYTPNRGYITVSFSTQFTTSNTFSNEICQTSDPPCHEVYKDMWNLFYTEHTSQCNLGAEVKDLLEKPIESLEDLVKTHLPKMFASNVLDLVENFYESSNTHMLSVTTENFLSFADSKDCLATESGLHFKNIPLIDETFIKADIFRCRQGWGGNLCNIPYCSHGTCNTTYGKCIAPDTCFCNSGRFGFNCLGDCKETCINGICNDGVRGDGKCLLCHWLYRGDYCSGKEVIFGLIAAILGTLVVSAFVIMHVMKHLQTREQTAEAIVEATEPDYTLSFEDIESIEDIDFEHRVTYKQLLKKLTYTKYRKGTLFTGQDFFMKSFNKAYFNLSLGAKTELKQICQLNHENISKLFGIMINQSTVALVTDVATMGSLYDVLHDRNIPIAWDVKYSILQDIARGMSYLHDVVHIEYGRLKSTNCLLHQGWLVKLTDIGLRKIRAPKREKKDSEHEGDETHTLKSNTIKILRKRKKSSYVVEEEEESDYKSLLWTAPEFINRGAISLDEIIRFTPQADVYSFGIIISEMVNRRPPYSDVTVMTIPHIIQAIGHLRDPILNIGQMNAAKNDLQDNQAERSGLLRPSVEDANFPKDESERGILRNLMESCWSEIPDERPPFAYCLEALELITPLKGNQTNKRAVLLERETESLEQYIGYDTLQILKEREKHNDLLSRLIPPILFQQFNDKEFVKPKHYNNVTIMAYHIVNIMEIIKGSSPTQTVAIIDYVQRAIDTIINTRKLKVIELANYHPDSILASGLPNQNGIRHAVDIVTLATKLVAATKNFKINHLPDIRIAIQVGVHTGPVLDGIINHLNPCYLVTGDALRNAKLIESHGLPNQVHVSKKTVSYLSHQDFDIVSRMTFKLKIDRQIMKTYWVNEK